jgi:hypothetical protein
LCRRIIDRHWFPTCFRAGFHTERPDSHWFLEQWVPFDFSNQSMAMTALEQGQADMVDGRFGDWRRAPSDWSPYHPSHDDYQMPGQCNRTIFRCLNIGTRARLLDQTGIDAAFARADSNIPTILAFTDHDFRDMRRDVATLHGMFVAASKRFPQVQWIHSRARSAARAVLSLAAATLPELSITFTRKRGSLRVHVTSNCDSFGPQPFLAIKSYDRRYLSDNFDFDIPRRSWSYTCDEQTVNPMAIEKIGIAFTDSTGSSLVTVVENVREILEGSEPRFTTKLQ